ncbi:MAG: hypothetical protein FWE97_02170 [Dehalococcoidia bacterium]|nr:hypothetical protein [Dehalococcoidia bacterium]
MNKKLLIIIAILIVTLPVIAGCTLRTSKEPQSMPPDIPHPADDVRFRNCLACHANDMLRAKAPLDHVAFKYTNTECSDMVVCHAKQDGSFNNR